MSILAYFPYLKKIKLGSWDRILSVCVLCIPFVNFGMPEPIFMKLGILHDPSHQCLRQDAYPPVLLLRNGSVNTFPKQWIHTIEEMLGTSSSTRSVFCQRGVCRSVYPLSLLGNNSVNTFPHQRRIYGGVIFYAVRVIKEKYAVS
jgi:hypothetical protein